MDARAAEPHIISTVAGTGTGGFAGDGGPAASAHLYSPAGVAVGADGALYIADQVNHRVRRVDAQTGVITTLAGDSTHSGGTGGFGGDGGPATAAQLNYPADVALAADGSLYIADFLNHRVRRVDAQSAVISTVAGTGEPGFGGDGGPAVDAMLYGPVGLAFAPDGSLYIADLANNRVRKVDATTGVITTAAGGLDSGGPGIGGFSGDGGPAVRAELHEPRDVAFAADGSFYIADSRNDRVRKVDPAGIITTVAGSDTRGFAGDGGPAVDAQLQRPSGVAVGRDGNLYIADSYNHRIRKLDTATGIIATVAGSGPTGVDAGSYAGDGGPADAARLFDPHGMTFGNDGSLYIADARNHRVRKVRELAPDITAPAAPTLLAAPPAQTTDRTARFVFAGEPGGNYECALDRGAWEPCTSPATHSGLALGAHTFKVRQVDTAGNTGQPTTVSFTIVESPEPLDPTQPKPVDPVKPEPEPNAHTVTLVAPATVTMTGSRLTVACRPDQGTLTSCEADAYATVRGKRIKVGSGRADGTGVVRVKLTRRGQRLVHRLGGVRVRLSVRATNAAGVVLTSGLRVRALPQRVLVVPSDGLFASGKSKPLAAAKRYLRRVAGQLEGAKRVLCVGHTDSIGTRPKNQRLALARAKAVCTLLKRAGVNAKLVTSSRGETRPRAGNDTRRGRALNRRVELTVSY